MDMRGWRWGHFFPKSMAASGTPAVLCRHASAAPLAACVGHFVAKRALRRAAQGLLGLGDETAHYRRCIVLALDRIHVGAWGIAREATIFHAAAVHALQ